MTRVTFTRDGKKISAQEGQSVGAALWAHGDRALSRSLKFHRPRGWYCGTGKCNQCMMRVDGVPNVKTCITQAREGMVVEGQNAWPSVRHDLFRGSDVVFRKGFDHHRAFVRPHFLYPLFSKVIRAFAGWGRLPDTEPPAPSVETARPDVVVIGGGPAGLAAGVAAAGLGARTMLFDDRPEAGGSAAFLVGTVEDPDNGGAVEVSSLVRRWKAEARQADRLDLRGGMTVSAVYRDGLVLAQARDRMLAIVPQSIIVATGAHEAHGVFEGNDLPGVMTAHGCLALLVANGVRPGGRAVVYGAGDHGLQVAEALVAGGVEVRAVVEPATEPSGSDARERLDAIGVPLWTTTQIERAKGLGRVKAVRVYGADGARTIHADLLVVALGGKSAPEVFQAMGARLRHDPWQGGVVPVLGDDLQTSVPGLFAAGDCAGVGTLASARTSGRLAGLAAAAHAGHGPAPEAETERLRELLGREPSRAGGPVPGGAAKVAEVSA
ncbi:MAG: (2Fe-2S)-binding protein [Euryarchaeota archaeon]|nr:(2Fe-2S)-binding protein [Euryarchaeota archaeon]